MDITVCIVAYECREKLRACLQSIRAKSGAVDYEVIVVDNASSDGTADMVADEFFWAKLIRNTDNRGFAAANNQALSQATGQYLMLLNPDTELTGGALEALVRFLRERPWVGALGPRLVYPDGSLQYSCCAFPTPMTLLIDSLGLSRAFPRSRVFGRQRMTWWDHSRSHKVDWVSGAALVMSRPAYRRVGPLDEGFFMYAEELDWQWRLRREGFECWYCPDVTIVHHEYASWQGRRLAQVLWGHQSLWRYFRKSYGRADEMAARVLTALGAFLRMVYWSPNALLPNAEYARQLTRLHAKVLALATGMTRAEKW
jgi:N-acetylglucosaminyl-diphospho-decaprenol L-rhamnosyltransferase